MKITSYKKIKSNLYQITLEDKSKIDLYDDIILKSGLLLKKEISTNELNNLISLNSYYELYNKALKYVSTKMRSEKEIRIKFKDYKKEDLDKLISTLRINNYINDTEYIKAFINDAINLKMIGYYKIKNDLSNLGLSEEEIIKNLDLIKDEVWSLKIKKLTDNMIKNNHKYSVSLLKNKILTNLINKGFSKEQITEYLETLDLKDDNDIYMKEYNKLLKKLSSKYSGKELEMQINNRLRAKGF